jgi:hypothetical protein
MACDDLACIADNGCISTLPTGAVGQVLIVDSSGRPSWQPAANAVNVSAFPNNAITERSDGLYAPRVLPQVSHNRFGVILDTLNVDAGATPPTHAILQSVDFTITNPDLVRFFYAHIVSHGYMLLRGTGAFNVGMYHYLKVNGVWQSRAIGQNEVGDPKASFTGSASTAFSLAPGTSVTITLANEIDVYAGTVIGTVPTPSGSDLSYSWVGLVI